MFLPPYSPDLNPIEMAFAKLKAHLRAMAMRTNENLEPSGKSAICQPKGMRKLLKAAGYGFT